ncbi:hypothetical protein F5Y10DRAFT_288823 [Nemania abortiva]|nr:hypothetical protein F5Y10DRAFT_288823 [Nemania abortiva]
MVTNHAALHMTTSHAPHNVTERAAPPPNNTGSAISNIGFTSSPVVPYPGGQAHVIDTDTRNSTQSETPAQHSNQITSERWDEGRYGNSLVPLPSYEPCNGSLSLTKDICFCSPSPQLADHSPEHPNTLKTFPALVPSNLDVDYSIHHTPGTTRCPSSVDPTVHNIPIDKCTPNPKTGAIPILPNGTAADVVSLGWPQFPIDGATRSHINSPAQNYSIGSSPWPWISNNDLTTLPLPQSPISSCISPRLSVSGTKSPSVPKSLKKVKSKKAVSRSYKCCKSNSTQQLACLFSKHDPEQHMDCVPKKFDCISRLGQHLKQRHRLDLDHSPKFSRMRVPADRKWYWAWKEIFGEAVNPPECPFYHPLEDFKTQFRSQRPEMPQLEYVGIDWARDEKSLNYTSYTETSLAIGSDCELLGDKSLLSSMGGADGLPPGFFDVSLPIQQYDFGAEQSLEEFSSSDTQ